MVNKLKCWRKTPQKAQDLWVRKDDRKKVVITKVHHLLPKDENNQVFTIFKTRKGDIDSKLLAYKVDRGYALRKARDYMKKNDRC